MGYGIDHLARTSQITRARFEADNAADKEHASDPASRFKPVKDQIKSDANSGLIDGISKVGDDPESPLFTAPPITKDAFEKHKAWITQNFTNWRFDAPTFKSIAQDSKSNTETIEGYVSGKGKRISDLKVACKYAELDWSLVEQFNQNLKAAKDDDLLPAQIKIYRNPVEIYSWAGSQDSQIPTVLATTRQSAVQVAKADINRSQKAIKEFGFEFLYHTNFDANSSSAQAQFEQQHTPEQGYAPGAWQRYQQFTGAIKTLGDSQAYLAKESGQASTSEALKQGKQAAQAFVSDVFGKQLAVQQNWQELKSKGTLANEAVNKWEYDRNRVKNDAAAYKLWGDGQTGKAMADVAWWGGGNPDNKIAQNINNAALAAGSVANVKSLKTNAPAIYSEGVKNGVPYQVKQQEGTEPKVYVPGPITGNAVPMPKPPAPPTTSKPTSEANPSNTVVMTEKDGKWVTNAPSGTTSPAAATSTQQAKPATAGNVATQTTVLKNGRSDQTAVTVKLVEVKGTLYVPTSDGSLTVFDAKAYQQHANSLGISGYAQSFKAGTEVLAFKDPNTGALVVHAEGGPVVVKDKPQTSAASAAKPKLVFTTGGISPELIEYYGNKLADGTMKLAMGASDWAKAKIAQWQSARTTPAKIKQDIKSMTVEEQAALKSAVVEPTLKEQQDFMAAQIKKFAPDVKVDANKAIAPYVLNKLDGTEVNPPNKTTMYDLDVVSPSGDPFVKYLDNAATVEKYLPNTRFNFQSLGNIHAKLMEKDDAPIRKKEDGLSPPTDYRQYDLYKNSLTENYKYTSPSNIKSEMEIVYSKLNDRNLDNKDKNVFVKNFTDIYARLSKIRPFTDGNTRTIDSVMKEYARRNGFEITPKILFEDKYDNLSTLENNVWKTGDLTPLNSFFDKNIKAIDESKKK